MYVCVRARVCNLIQLYKILMILKKIDIKIFLVIYFHFLKNIFLYYLY